MKVDYLVVGSGLTGAVIARMLTDSGREVLVIERREHFGGNIHDHTHPCGIRIHTYGPHYFRTESDTIWQFINRFAIFEPYEAVVKSFVDGQYENWPIAASYIRHKISEDWEPDFRGLPTNFEEASLAMMPRQIYANFVKGYTEKQWGVPTQTLSANLAKRFDVRQDDDPRLTPQHKYQGIPSEGYTNLMRNMLHGIPVILKFDYMKNKKKIKPRKLLIFTGPIDEYFNYDLGRLVYRGQKRKHVYLPEIDKIQPSSQVNNPDPNNGPHIRTIEWKQIMPRQYAERIRGTVLTYEIPFSPTDPNLYEYPFPDEPNNRLYEQYRRRADTVPGLLICGRLGDYRYYDMDQAIGRAMMITKQILSDGK